MNILLVEDDQQVRSSLCEGLEKLGCRITETSGAESACGILASTSSFDCVVTDLDMPGTGERVIHSSLECAPERPVVVVSGCEDKQRLARCLENGAAEVVQKPVTPTKLNGIIRGLVATRA